MITKDLNKILKENYEEEKKSIRDFIICDIDHRKEKVSVCIKNETYEMTLGNYLTILIMVRPYVKNGIDFDMEELFARNIDITDVNDHVKYFDFIIMKCRENDIIINETLTAVLDEMTEIVGVINQNYGSSISLKSIIDLAKNNEEFNEIINLTIDTEKSYAEVDDIMKITNDNLRRLVDILKNEDNILRSYILSKSGINEKQLGQVLSYVSLKPDFNENIIPVPINTSFARGLQNVQEYYINAIGARKALIMSHKQVRSAGYLTRKLSLLTIDEFINDTDDCGSIHPLPLFIENKDILRDMNGRWFYNDNDELELITEEREELIGETLYVRSPITCACENGICHKCYGELYKVNKDMNIGIISCLLLTNPLTQRLLSSKHLLQANVDKIDWDESFYKYFNIYQDSMTLKETSHRVIVYSEDIAIDEESDCENITFTKFYVKDQGVEVPFESPINLMLNEELENDIDKFYNKEEEKYEFKTKDLTESENIFNFIIENNGLSASLIEIKSLIEKDVFISEHTIEDTYQHFVDLINKSGISINLVHIEIILKQMVQLFNPRSSLKDDETFEKDYSYTINNISESIQRSNYVGKSLVFEQVYKQLMTDSFHTMDKNGSSVIDTLLV